MKKLQWYIHRDGGMGFVRYWGREDPSRAAHWTSNKKYAFHFKFKAAANAVARQSGSPYILVQEVTK